MTKQQIILVASAVGLTLTLYFGCATKDAKQATLDRSRALNATENSTKGSDIASSEAKKALSADKAQQLSGLEATLSKQTDDKSRLAPLESLAHFWYEAGDAATSAQYAEQIASINNSENAWMTAGSTYYIGIQQNAEKPELKKMCFEKATKAIQNAISLNPENITNRVNLALCYVENPSQDNPMEGILMLRELDSKHPDNPSVLFQLGRLAIRTGQFEKAVARLEKVVSLQPDNAKAFCLLAEGYNGVGKKAEADKAASKCK